MTVPLPEREVIEADPVFQLNTVLWSLFPSQGGEYRAVLREHGYFLHSIGRELQIPGAFREALSKLTGGYDSPCPDVLADHQEDPTMLVFECKASSYGPESSTAKQGLKLLVGASDISDTVGASDRRRGHLIVATRETEDHRMYETLRELASTLKDNGLDPSDASSVTIKVESDGVWLRLGAGDTPPSPLAQALAKPVRVVEREADDLPLPFYIIPWDPSVTQDPKLESFGKALLGARLLNEATAIVGRSAPPETLTLNAALLLSAATFDAAKHWRARGDVRKVESLIATRLERWLGEVPDLDVTRHNNPHEVQITIKSVDQQAEVVSTLERVDVWDSLSGAEQPPLQFD